MVIFAFTAAQCLTLVSKYCFRQPPARKKHSQNYLRPKILLWDMSYYFVIWDSFETTRTTLWIEKRVPKDINDKLRKVIPGSLRNFLFILILKDKGFLKCLKIHHLYSLIKGVFAAHFWVRSIFLSACPKIPQKKTMVYITKPRHSVVCGLFASYA